MKILLVEDDPVIASLVKNSLSSDGHVVEISKDGSDGTFLAKNYEYDLILLDQTLPKRSGIEICRDVRSIGKKMPILFLSILGDTDTKVSALDVGADDYLLKPFAIEELKARIRALIRRPNDIKDTSILEADGVIMNTNKRTVKYEGKDIPLTNKEYNILEYMIRHKGIVLSRANILEYAWMADNDPISNTVESHIRNIRKKLKSPKKGDLIHNIPGRGYILERR
jgi:two-component system OmpR family response regulator